MVGSRWLGVGLLILAGVAMAGLSVGGEAEQIVMAGAEPLPLMVLAVFAYLGVESRRARAITVLWLLLVVAAVGLLGLLISVDALTAQPVAGGEPSSDLVPNAGDELLAIIAGSVAAFIAGAACFLPAVRRFLSRFLPIDPDSFVHTIALVAVVSITIVSFVPLLRLGIPPLLSTPAATGEAGTGSTRDTVGSLRDDLYGLAWTIPAAIFAVGFGVRRSLRESLGRLGLVRPSLLQVAGGLAAGALLVVAAHLVGPWIDSYWSGQNWDRTDEDAFGNLMAYAMSPAGAIVTGLTAGLGEELAVRGVLQPRIGIVLSNLFFTSLHALQYNWDALLMVFFIGLVMGVIRKRTNTTTSAIAHGSYDCFLTLLSLYPLPGF